MVPKIKKHIKKKKQNNITGEIPVMQFTSKWGKDKEIYFESGDSGTESDEEHLVQEAIELENNRLSNLTEKDFKAFGSVATFTRPLELPKSFENLEEEINNTELIELKQNIRQIINDIVISSKYLEEEKGTSILDKATIQLLHNLITNCSFYLYLVSSGFKSTFHPCLEHVNLIKEKLIFIFNKDQLINEDEEEEFIEECVDNEENIEIKHIPDHLKKVSEGEHRLVTKEILYNKVIQPNTPDWRKNPRTERRKKYSRALHKYNNTHKKKSLPGDGIYKGERSGISKNTIKSTSLKSAH